MLDTSTIDNSNEISPPKVIIGIDWSNPSSKVSKYFTVKEAIFLPTWGRLATEEDGLTEIIKGNLKYICSKMDNIRDELNKPITVHVTYRPAKYNEQIGGAQNSAHVKGLAMDWSITHDNCDELRKTIVVSGLLEKYEMRMEDLPGSGWVHLDLYPVGASGKRFFKP